MKYQFIWVLLGIIIGIIIAAKIGIGDNVTTNNNEIGKIKTKGDNSPIDVEQIRPTEPAKKKPFFKRIFKKR